MDFENEIFKRTIPDYNKLVKYGFILDNNSYKYSINLIDDLEAEITILNDKLTGKIIDTAFNEEYTNHRVEEQTGSFVGMVREKYISLLEDIKNKCFTEKPFIFNQSNRLASAILKKYNCKPLFKWENNDSAVFENNNKWFGVILNVDRSKFSDLKGEIEVLNVKLDEHKINRLLKEKGFYKAYHMNKKYWITITLDDTISDDKIMDLIDESYSYTLTFKGSKNEWVMPVNPYYFDIFAYFDSTDTYYWDEKKNFEKGDTVYLYVTRPYQEIMYKCRVEDFTDDFMIIKKICKFDDHQYPLETLKKYGLTSVRSARHIPVKLSEYFKKNGS